MSAQDHIVHSKNDCNAPAARMQPGIRVRRFFLPPHVRACRLRVPGRDWPGGVAPPLRAPRKLPVVNARQRSQLKGGRRPARGGLTVYHYALIDRLARPAARARPRAALDYE